MNRTLNSASPTLLVSIRDRAEFDVVLGAGVEIIDFKEPSRGPLAPVDPRLWHEAASRQIVPRSAGPGDGRPLFSAALGERDEAIEIARWVPAAFAFAKVGPSGCDSLDRLVDLWTAVGKRLDVHVQLVPVAYADHQRAGCLAAESVFRAALAAGHRRCLLDTFTKDGRSTVDHLGIDRLRRLSALARQAGLWWALAGSIHLGCVGELRDAGVLPDCYAVRGSVCDRGRRGSLSLDRVERWMESLAAGKLASR